MYIIRGAAVGGALLKFFVKGGRTKRGEPFKRGSTVFQMSAIVENILPIGDPLKIT